MKCGVRLRLLIAFVLLIVTFILLGVLEDKCETYGPVSYVQASIPWLFDEPQSRPLPKHSSSQDKIIVVPAMAHDETSWIAEELPDWQRAIYLVNPTTDEERSDVLTTPMNKGKEAMAYLTYIIDHYNTTIPSVVAFLHSHRNGFFDAWHVDTPLHDNVFAMKNLQLHYVRKRGYVNLRCNLNPGCKKVWRTNTHINGEVWNEIFEGTSTPVFNPGELGPGAMNGTSMLDDPERSRFVGMSIWSPCCAQFVVTRDQIYKRPLQDYVAIRDWVIETEKDDAHSGRVLEYLWHIIFGREAVHCPDPQTCYCNVYGRC